MFINKITAGKALNENETGKTIEWVKKKINNYYINKEAIEPNFKRKKNF